MDNLPISVGLDSWCRTCMSGTATVFDLFLDTIHNTTLANILMSCTTLSIKTEDGLPKKICTSCYNNLKNFTDFRDKVQNVDLKFKEVLNKFTKDIKSDGVIKIECDPIDTYTVMESANLKNEWEVQPEIKYSVDNSLDGTYYEDNNDLFVNEINADRENSTDIKQNEIENNENMDYKIYNCKKCSKKFKTIANYKKHLSKHKSAIANVSIEFDRTINNNKKIKNEYNEVHECELCRQVFRSLPSLSAHKRKHAVKGRVLACSTCNKVFKKISHLKRHEVIHLHKEPHKCSKCPKSFRTENQLKAHLNFHNDCKPHICHICDKAFTSITSLNTHIKIHNRDKTFLCPTCGKRFDSNTNLNQHLRRHIGIKMFACSLCPKKFVSKGELKSHCITHTGERLYKCETCGAGFTKHSSLTQHKLRHLGLKPHQCDACPMKFTSKDHLKRHYRIHTGEKPYRCDMCERAFTQSNDLVKHQRGHLGDNMYKCPQCQESFRLKTELRQHITQHYMSAQTEPSSTVIDHPTDLISKPVLLTAIVNEMDNVDES